MVEPDRVFVEVCKEFFPDNACGLGDKRVSIYYEDGLKFLRLKQNEYDLIINDAIDPLGHNAGLFTKEFYGNCYRALKEDGIMVYQHGSPFQSAGYIRHTFRLVLRDTGFLVLLPRNTIHWNIWMPKDGRNVILKPGIIQPICTKEPLCCRDM